MTRLRRLHAMLSAEDGLALVFALGVLLVLGILTAALLQLAASSRVGAARDGSTVRATSLAQAGLNAAESLLWAMPDPSVQGSMPSVATALPLQTGTAYYWGQLTNGVWTLYGRGTVATEPGLTSVSRSTSMQVQVAGGTSTTADLSAWNVLYSDAKTGCMTVSNNATLRSSLYVAGNLCLSNNAAVTGTGTVLQVGGTLTIGNNGYVGTSATRVAKALVAGGCGANRHVCSTADSVYATTTGTTIAPITKPPVDLTSWRANAPLGPNHGCTVGALPVGVTFTSASVDLFPSGSDYDCKALDSSGATVAELGWNHLTHAFTIAGTAFFDGNLNSANSNVTVTYSGRATIYSAGTIRLSNNIRLCATANCDASWNPAQNLLVLVAGSGTASTGLLIDNNGVFQGGAYAVDDIDFSNNGTLIGPGIARQLYVSNNATYPPFTSLPPGAPSTPVITTTPTTLTPVPASTRY